MTVKNYDRSGFAHLNNSGVGAYNDDGSLKSNARVLYVTAQTAKTVTCEVKTGSKATNVAVYTGLQAIIGAYQKGYETRPLDVRFIGLVEKDDLDAVFSSAEGLQIKGKNAYSNLYITLEGIGDDATIRGFGFLLRNAANVENFATSPLCVAWTTACHSIRIINTSGCTTSTCSMDRKAVMPIR